MPSSIGPRSIASEAGPRSGSAETRGVAGPHAVHRSHSTAFGLGPGARVPARDIVRALKAFALAILVSGCAGEGASAPPAPRSAAPAAIRAFAATGLRIAPIAAPLGEDGRGATVTAVHPVAIDVLAAAWPGRALDPVLEVGDLRFHHYSHPAPGVLRFVAADGTAIPAEGEVAIQWGRERTVVPR